MLPTLSNEKFACTVRLSITGISHVSDEDSASGMHSNPTPSNIISINAILILSITNYLIWNMNNCRTEFLLEYIKIYLHIWSFLGIEMVWLIKILPRSREGLVRPF